MGTIELQRHKFKMSVMTWRARPARQKFYMGYHDAAGNVANDLRAYTHVQLSDHRRFNVGRVVVLNNLVARSSLSKL
jgi:hypothetical protein